jgi:hypothetical protein
MIFGRRSWKTWANTKRDVWANTRQREQYMGTVHLFIGTGRSLWEITFMPFTNNYNHNTRYHGPIGHFIFKSVHLVVCYEALWLAASALLLCRSSEGVYSYGTFGDEADPQQYLSGSIQYHELIMYLHYQWSMKHDHQSKHVLVYKNHYYPT